MARAPSPADTPVMRQYLSFKERHRDAILFFRMGDFYEMFFADAELAARELGLTLTSRDKGKEGSVPMAGVPYHAAEGYIARLVRKGHRVAVCEQLGDPARARGLVDRGVTEVITPGTALSDALVAETANNYVAAAHRARDVVGFAAADITTGEFLLEDFRSSGSSRRCRASPSRSGWCRKARTSLPSPRMRRFRSAAPDGGSRRGGDGASWRRTSGCKASRASTATIWAPASGREARFSTTCARCAARSWAISFAPAASARATSWCWTPPPGGTSSSPRRSSATAAT